MKIVTGASGCVGRYLVETLLDGTDHDLVLAVRDAGKLILSDAERARVSVVEADMRDLAERAASAGLLDGVEAALLVATAWGGDDTYAVTVDANLAITDALIAAGCKHILYFATASVLDQKGGMLPAAREHGTDYIKAKHMLVEGMEQRADKVRLTGLFPTLVFGGRRAAPEIRLSHFANLMTEIRPYAWAVRFVSADGWFNIVHAQDIARVSRHLVEAGGPSDGPARVVLGNPVATIDEMIAQFARATGRKKRTIFRAKPSHVDFLVRILPIQLSPWDRFCVDHPDQSHPGAVNPASFGLPVTMPDLVTGLASIGIGAAVR